MGSQLRQGRCLCGRAGPFSGGALAQGMLHSLTFPWVARLRARVLDG